MVASTTLMAVLEKEDIIIETNYSGVNCLNQQSEGDSMCIYIISGSGCDSDSNFRSINNSGSDCGGSGNRGGSLCVLMGVAGCVTQTASGGGGGDDMYV